MVRKTMIFALGVIWLIIVISPGAEGRSGYAVVPSKSNIACNLDLSGFFGEEKRPPPPAPLSAPTDVSTFVVSDTMINVVWNAGAPASKYKVFRNGVPLAVTTAPNYSDSHLQGATNYCYHIVAIDGMEKESAPSSRSCVTTLTAPEKAPGPKGLAVTTVSESQLDIKWDPMDSAVGYKVYRDGIYLRTAGKDAAISDKELRKENRYCYRAAAVDESGRESSWSDEVCAVARVVDLDMGTSEGATSSAVEMLAKGRARMNIEFDFNKYVVKPMYHQELKAFSDVMTAYPEWTVVIEGHTDNIGADAYNMKLSLARAEAVRACLIKDFGIKGRRLISKGYGKTKPIRGNETAAGRQKNRRVEAVVVNYSKK